MRARGFTLIELLVVIAILALTVTLVPPLLSGGQARAEFVAAAQDLASSLREARGLAIRLGRTQTFAADTEARRFGFADHLRQLPNGIAVAAFAASGQRIEDRVMHIDFFADGSSSGGALRLFQGERRSDVRVDWLTGRVSLETGAPTRR